MADFSNVYSQMFADFFLQRAQEAGGQLNGTVREMHGLVGDAYKLKYYDSLSMETHGAYNSDIPNTDAITTAPTITFKDYVLKVAVDQFEQLNFNANAVAGLAETHAMAIGRARDQYIYSALEAGATKTVADGGTNMTVAKLRDARKQLGADGTQGPLYLVMHWNNLDALLGETEYTSSIFNAAKPLVNPQGRGEFMGFNLIVVGDYPNIDGAAAGLPLSGNIRKCYAYSQHGLTLGFRMDPRVKYVPIPQNERIETLSSMSAGAVVGDARQVVEISCDES